MHEDFEQIVQDDKYLNILINQQKFGAINGLKKTDKMTPEFIDWISPKFYDSVKTIYDRTTLENEGEMCSVMRVCYLANEATKEKITELVTPTIDRANESFHNFYEVIRNNKHDYLTGLVHLKPVGHLVNAIFLYLDTPSIQDKKEIHAKTLIGCAEILKGATRRSDAVKYAIYEGVIGRLKKLNLSGEYGEKVVVHENKLKSKAAWGIVVTVIIILLILVRFLGRL